MKPTVRILHLTDLHLFNDPNAMLVGINPLQSLQRVVNKIKNYHQQKQPDLIVLTGDISQDYSLESYKIAKQILQEFSSPVVATMGNHDRLSIFAEIFGNPSQLVTAISNLTNWNIILLNSYWPDHVAGQLTDSDLAFLQTTLDNNQTQPVIIFLHHQVVPIGSTWLDKINLKNSHQFLEIITKYKNVKMVVCGHVHQETTSTYREIPFISTPATCWQFMVKSPDFALDNLMPGYRLIDLYEDGSIQTEVIRVDHDNAFIPDHNSKGY